MGREGGGVCVCGKRGASVWRDLCVCVCVCVCVCARRASAWGGRGDLDLLHHRVGRHAFVRPLRVCVHIRVCV